jgi:hypothetical protein
MSNIRTNPELPDLSVLLAPPPSFRLLCAALRQYCSVLCGAVRPLRLLAAGSWRPPGSWTGLLLRPFNYHESSYGEGDGGDGKLQTPDTRIPQLATANQKGPSFRPVFFEPIQNALTRSPHCCDPSKVVASIRNIIAPAPW